MKIGAKKIWGMCVHTCAHLSAMSLLLRVVCLPLGSGVCSVCVDLSVLCSPVCFVLLLGVVCLPL